mgnify:CR=1 FL=1
MASSKPDGISAMFTERTTCPYCGVGCGVQARPDANGGTTIIGDPDHPANFGKLCSKGFALDETLSLNGRLLHPKLRRADGSYADVDWDTALANVADGFKRIVERDGPGAVAFYLSGQLLTEDYYVANKLLWNPDADVAAVLSDFYEKAFGPAAPAMRRYYERVAPDVEPLLSRGLVGEAFRDVEEAARLAKDRPDVLARLDHVKHYLRYVHLRWLLDHEKDKTRRKELTVTALTHCYRTRYEYMTHWAAMRNTWANQAAKEFVEPTWVAGDKAAKPWTVDRVVTREETDAWFREGLDYFRPTPVEQLKFSTEFVPVAFPAPKPVGIKQQFQRSAQYALHSSEGEPLEVTITPGVITSYRDRPDARYTLKDAAGKVVAQGSLKLDGEPHPVNMKVPAAGTYVFEFNDSSAGWGMAVAAGRSAVLLSNRGRRLLHLGQLQETFFYVPKGTKQLQYFWSGGPHKVLGPDHKSVAEVTSSDEVVTVAVPAGADGKVWSFTPHAHGHLWFFNAPNVLAASPDSLLLPKELVTADGLATPKK